MAGDVNRLAVGRAFHAEVQRDFESRADADWDRRNIEHRLVEASGRVGRADLWIVYERSETGEPLSAAIHEVKSTDWDLTASSRIRQNVLRTARQLWRYIDAAMDVESLAVSAHVIFPQAPSDVFRQRTIEVLFGERGILVLWWRDGTVTPYELLDAVEEGVETFDVLMALDPSLLGSTSGDPPTPPAWVAAACLAGRAAHSRAAMGRIVWENL